MGVAVPTYRVLYVEREPRSPLASSGDIHAFDRYQFPRPKDYYTETEWEEEVEARDPAQALERFLQEHAPRDGLGYIDDEGNAQQVSGWDYDPVKRYVWIEEGKLMEYQGIHEATPGLVICPLCAGEGEVDEELAAEFDEVWGTDGDGIDADVQG